MSRALAQSMLIAAALVTLGACKSSVNANAKTSDRAEALSGDLKGSGGERCSATNKADREISEYDTSGDGVPDVRKVYLSTGAGTDARLVMICRETDVNGDGKKDVIRYYDDDGRSLREEADRNFDHKMDMVIVFQDGKVVREELDENRDGKIDTKIFMDNGKPLRAERDLAGRSTTAEWRPDRWEYYEDGKMVRMGTDLDGDKRVDRWDRDLEFKAAKDAAEAAKAEAVGAAEEPPDTDTMTTPIPTKGAPSSAAPAKGTAGSPATAPAIKAK